MNHRPIRLIAIFIYLLAFPIAVLAQDDSSLKTYRGTLAPGAEKTFRIEARVGQYINAKITSEKGNVKIAEEEGATELTVAVTEEGYDLVIRNQGKSRDRYQLTVKVNTPEPEPAEDVTPAEGSKMRIYDLTMYPYKFKRRFSVRLKKGEGARISIEPRSVAERLKLTIAGVEENESPEETGYGFPFVFRAAKDVVFVFEIVKSDEMILEAKVTIAVQ